MIQIKSSKHHKSIRQKLKSPFSFKNLSGTSCEGLPRWGTELNQKYDLKGMKLVINIR